VSILGFLAIGHAEWRIFTDRTRRHSRRWVPPQSPGSGTQGQKSGVVCHFDCDRLLGMAWSHAAMTIERSS